MALHSASLNFLGLDVDGSLLHSSEPTSVGDVQAWIEPTVFPLAPPVIKKWHSLVPFLHARIRVLQLLKNFGDSWRVSRHVVRDFDLAAL